MLQLLALVLPILHNLITSTACYCTNELINERLEGGAAGANYRIFVRIRSSYRVGRVCVKCVRIAIYT